MGEKLNADRAPLGRRDFLKLAAASALGMAGSGALSRPAGAAEGAIVRPMPFSTSTIMYRELPLDQAVAEIAKTGVQAVDVWELTAKDKQNHFAWIEQNGPDKFRALLEQHKLKLFAFSIYFTPGPKRAQRLEMLKECGGQVAVLGVGGKTMPLAVESLKPLAEKAEALGVKVAGENHGGAVLNTIASMREYVSLAKSPALGMALAPYHVMGAKESVAEAVEAVGDKLFFFYAWQRAPAMKELPGDGALDFGPVIAALRKIGYPHYLNIFTHAHAPADQMTSAAIASRQYLEKLM